MYPYLYSIALLANIFFLSLKVDTIQPQRPFISKVATPETAATYLSDWETVSHWDSYKENNLHLYFFNRKTPQLNASVINGDAVVIFAKGYDFEGFSKSAEQPLGLPFYLMSTTEKLTDSNAWVSENREGNIKVALSMSKDLESSFLKNNNKIQFRYFVLSSDFLRQNNLTPQSLRSLSYSKLVQLLGVAS